MSDDPDFVLPESHNQTSQAERAAIIQWLYYSHQHEIPKQQALAWITELNQSALASPADPARRVN
jgi:hypothetical protein